MADLTDVENYLVNTIAAAIYPDGTDEPSVAGIDAMVYAGSPSPSQLDADFSPSNTSVRAHITVNHLMDRDASDLLNGWQTVSINSPTLTLTVDDIANTITVGGVVSSPQNCAIKVNAIVYHYAVQIGDTLETIATNIAALIPNASALLTVITIPNAYLLITRVGKTGRAINAVGQQQAVFKISVLAPSYIYRMSFSKAIQSYLDNNYRFVLPDTTGANMVYKNTRQFDDYQKTIIYRRDLMYQVTYYTTIERDFYTIIDTPINISYVPEIN
jgi:hypothetical protein